MTRTVPPAAVVFILAVPCMPGCLVESVCYHDADCGPGRVCAIEAGASWGACRPACRNDQDCTGNLLCDPATGRCVEPECRADGDCPEGFVCTEGRCVSEQPLRCPEDMVAVENRFCIDIHEASRPDATATHPGTDGTRAVSRAGVMPWAVPNNATAQAACEASGKTLCTEDQWYTACRGPAGTVYGYGDAYDAAICNGIDKYCYCGAGTTCEDEDPCPFPGCYHKCRAAFRLDPTGSNQGCTNGYGVYDMNGNLWEHVLGGDETRIRGGAFNCSDSVTLHRCDYIPGTWRPSARGFRCCSAGVQDGGEGS